MRGELAAEDAGAARFEPGVPYLAQTAAEVIERGKRRRVTATAIDGCPPRERRLSPF